MTAKIIVQGMYDKTPAGYVPINTTSKGGWTSDLSPFKLGPCPLYGGRTARNMENAWQFAKVYDKHADATGAPLPAYWAWARAGWADPVPRRYPMGKGAKPLYSLWDDQRLGYVAARAAIYAPLYAKLVQATAAYEQLVGLLDDGQKLALRDYDGYRHDTKGMSLTDVHNCTTRKMGHAFVLAALLTRDPVLALWGL